MNEDWFVRERKIFTLIKKCCVITVREFGCTTAEGEFFFNSLAFIYRPYIVPPPVFSSCLFRFFMTVILMERSFCYHIEEDLIPILQIQGIM